MVRLGIRLEDRGGIHLRGAFRFPNQNGVKRDHKRMQERWAGAFGDLCDARSTQVTEVCRRLASLVKWCKRNPNLGRFGDLVIKGVDQTDTAL